MKRQMFFVSIGLVLVLSTGGCTAIQKILFHERHEITTSDAKKIHPRSHLSHHHIRLTLEQAQAMNQLYGQAIAAEGNVITYYEARPQKGIYGERGNIFLVQAKGESGLLDILVCTTDGQIDEVLIKDGRSPDGHLAISAQFLDQFIGRTLQDSWKVAQTASDLVDLPAKLRPLAGDIRTSEEVASAIRKILVWAQVLQIQ